MMTLHVEHAVERLRDVEHDVRRATDRRLRRWRRRISRRKVWFDKELQKSHRLLRQGLPAYFRDANIFSLLTAPVIYSLIVPLLVLDLWVMIYQSICFPIYGIARVPRRRYFSIDRHKLAYLNAIEKLNCTFCSYANGLFAYVREVAGRTEQYWCPIKHARRIPEPHRHYRSYFEYGDATAYRTGLPAVRRDLHANPRRAMPHTPGEN